MADSTGKRDRSDDARVEEPQEHEERRESAGHDAPDEAVPPRTDHIEERQEHVGRADWNASQRAGREQPEDTSPDVRRGRSTDDVEQEDLDSDAPGGGKRG